MVKVDAAVGSGGDRTSRQLPCRPLFRDEAIPHAVYGRLVDADRLARRGLGARATYRVTTLSQLMIMSLMVSVNPSTSSRTRSIASLISLWPCRVPSPDVKDMWLMKSEE